MSTDTGAVARARAANREREDREMRSLFLAYQKQVVEATREEVARAVNQVVTSRERGDLYPLSAQITDALLSTFTITRKTKQREEDG